MNSLRLGSRLSELDAVFPHSICITGPRIWGGRGLSLPRNWVRIKAGSGTYQRPCCKPWPQHVPTQPNPLVNQASIVAHVGDCHAVCLQDGDLRLEKYSGLAQEQAYCAQKHLKQGQYVFVKIVDICTCKICLHEATEY